MLTDLSFLEIGQPWPVPDQDTKDRLDLYRNNKKLFEGKHQEVFKDWVRLLRSDHQATMEIILNWHRRLSTLWADLLLGEPPRITASKSDDSSGDDMQDEIEDMVEYNDLFNRIYETVLDVSRYGDGPLKVYSQTDDENQTRGVIMAQQPAVWYPVVNPVNIKEFIYHVLAWEYKEGDKRVLFVEIHEKGKYTKRKYWIDNGILKSQLQAEETITHLATNDFLIVPVQNLITSDRSTGLDDYSDLDTVLQELEMRVAQIARILDKHSDPNMHGPASAMEQTETGEWTVRGGGKFWPREPGEEPPGYVIWDGQLDAAFKQIDLLIEQLYALSETSPAAFGQLKSGLAESGSALKRLLMAPLAKVNRIRMRLDPALKKALRIAGKLQGVEFEEIKIEWHDGLPIDDKEQADIDSTLYAAGLLSLETSLRHRGFEGQALDDEMARIKKEKEESQPKVDPNKGPDITGALDAMRKGLTEPPKPEPPKPEPPKPPEPPQK